MLKTRRRNLKQQLNYKLLKANQNVHLHNMDLKSRGKEIKINEYDAKAWMEKIK
jgi:hypothetical protein